MFKQVTILLILTLSVCHAQCCIDEHGRRTTQEQFCEDHKDHFERIEELLKQAELEPCEEDENPIKKLFENKDLLDPGISTDCDCFAWDFVEQDTSLVEYVHDVCYPYQKPEPFWVRLSFEYNKYTGEKKPFIANVWTDADLVAGSFIDSGTLEYFLAKEILRLDFSDEALRDCFYEHKLFVPSDSDQLQICTYETQFKPTSEEDFYSDPF